MLCDDLNGKEIQKRGDISVYMAVYTLCCIAKKKKKTEKQLSY